VAGCFSVVAQPFAKTTAPAKQISHRFVKTNSSANPSIRGGLLTACEQETPHGFYLPKDYRVNPKVD
jgi:hypothetical protein